MQSFLPCSLQQPPSKKAESEILKTEAGKEKKEDSVDTIQSMAVREKLKELETEIDKFRSENAALAKTRTEREEVRVTSQLVTKIICFLPLYPVKTVLKPPFP